MTVSIEELNDASAVEELPALARLMHACVQAGASINFILPFSLEDSELFWRERVLPGQIAGTRTVWIARVGEELAGSVQLDCDTPPNQRHRAEVAKLMVHPDHRRRGIARMLMCALEERVRATGRHLITLDTRTGDSAESLYKSMGYQVAGTIPGFCRDTFSERYDPTTIMYKSV